MGERKLKSRHDKAWKPSGLGQLFIDFQFLWNIHQMVPRVAKVLIPHIDQLFKQGFVYYSCESLLCKKELRGKKRKKNAASFSSLSTRREEKRHNWAIKFVDLNYIFFLPHIYTKFLEVCKFMNIIWNGYFKKRYFLTMLKAKLLQQTHIFFR